MREENLIMDIIFCILPFWVSLLAVATKRKMINSRSGKKYAYREMFIDGIRIIIITIISLIANFVCGKDIKTGALAIDGFMMISYLLPLLQKNYDYVERKALMGILLSFVFMLNITIVLFQMLIGIYDRTDLTLLYCFIKVVCYFTIAVWCCFTNGEKHKVKALCCGILDSCKNYKLGVSDYYVFACLGLLLFVGIKDYFTPIGIFGFHEVINKKYAKGVLYIVFGNLCLILQHSFQILGNIVFIIYILVALLDMFFHCKRFIVNI